MSESAIPAWLGLVEGALLLVWPISPKVPLLDLPGVFGGGTQQAANAPAVTPITAYGTPLPDRGDRARLAAGLFLLGLGAGAGPATMERPRRPLPDRPAVESHRSQHP